MGYEVISIPDDSDSERFFVGFQDEVTSYKDSFFTCFSLKIKSRSHHVVASMPHSSHVARTLTYPALLSSEMHDASFGRERARYYIQACTS